MIAQIFPEGHFALLMKIKVMPGGLFELSRTVACTTRNAVNRLQSCGTRTIKGGINLFIELHKQILDQIAARNIRISLDKRIAFSKKSYGISEEKRTRANMIPVIRIYLYLAVLIIAGPGVTT